MNKPWPIGEPDDADKVWHPEHESLFWYPVKGGKLYAHFVDGEIFGNPTYVALWDLEMKSQVVQIPGGLGNPAVA